MKTSYEAWADSFHFSEDLRVLEEYYHDQHREEIKQQVHPRQHKDTSPGPGHTGDEKFLSQLSEKIASRLGDYLSDSEAFTEYLRLNELEHDNALMARQIQELLGRLNQLEAENANLRHELSQYFHLFGKVYMKNS
jgi:hypothetical protein